MAWPRMKAGGIPATNLFFFSSVLSLSFLLFSLHSFTSSSSSFSASLSNSLSPAFLTFAFLSTPLQPIATSGATRSSGDDVVSPALGTRQSEIVSTSVPSDRKYQREESKSRFRLPHYLAPYISYNAIRIEANEECRLAVDPL